MLACRPMLSFALAVMAGVVLARYRPEYVSLLPYAWIAFAVLAGAFIFIPRKHAAASESLPEKLPENYAPHIHAKPGFLASRGLNRFILLACLGFFLLAVWRQDAWSRRLSPERLPERRWFNANLMALSPARDHYDEEAGAWWRVPALLLTADGLAAGAVPVRLSGRGDATFRRGDMIQARVGREPENPKAYPGAFDFRQWLERDGLVASLAIAGERVTVVPVEDAPLATRARRSLDHVRALAIGGTLRHGGEHGPMLAAMLYGYRKDLPADLRDAFRRVGIGHVLAISGLHVGLIVGLLWWLSGWIGWSGRWRAVACLVLAVVYLGLSGGQVAAARATLMAVIHLAGVACGRRGDMLNSLGAAAFFIVFANPGAPRDVSFQLSFTAVVFIYMALRRAPAERFVPELPHPEKRLPFWLRRFRRDVWSLTRLSIATWFGLFPIIASVFNQVNLVGLPINIVVIPLMSSVLAGGLLLPWLGWIPGVGWLLRAPSWFLSWLAMRADRLPYASFPAHAPSPARVALFYAIVFLLLLRGVIRSDKTRRRWSAALSAGLALSFTGLVCGMRSAPPPESGRLAVMPGRGLGTIVAESGEGGIAVLGAVARSGLNEAGWLHALRRGGGAAVVAVAADIEKVDAAALSYHYPVSETTVVARTDTTFPEAEKGWQPVPGAPGIEYAVSRAANGSLAWLAARTGGKAVCIAPRLAARQVTWRLERRVPGYDADLLCLSFSDRDLALPLTTMPRGRVALGGRRRGDLPERWFTRWHYGVLALDDELRGYDGEEWIVLDETK